MAGSACCSGVLESRTFEVDLRSEEARALSDAFVREDAEPDHVSALPLECSTYRRSHCGASIGYQILLQLSRSLTFSPGSGHYPHFSRMHTRPSQWLGSQC